MKVKATQLCPALCDPMDYAVHGILQAGMLEWMVFPSPGDLPNPGIKLRSFTLQADSLPAEPQGKPKITGVGSLSLLQRIFLTQESNRHLLHCRWILYQLSYQGSPQQQIKYQYIRECCHCSRRNVVSEAIKGKGRSVLKMLRREERKVWSETRVLLARRQCFVSLKTLLSGKH